MRSAAKTAPEAGKDGGREKRVLGAGVTALDKNLSETEGKGRVSPAPSDGDADPRCVSLARPDSYENGRYLELRASLEHKRPAGQGLVVAITSPAAGDGKSLTASNLAGAFAQNSGSRVLLVDADLRRQSESLRGYLGLTANSRFGLTDTVFEDGRSFHDSLLHVARYPNLSVLLRGTRDVDEYEALASSRFGALLKYARRSYHYVILDTAPVLPVPDYRAIARWADGFVMVVTARRTPRNVLAESLRNIGPEKMMGIVLNQCEPLSRRYHGYYGAYGGEDMRTRRRWRISR